MSKQQAANTTVKPFGAKDKFGYLFGDLGNGLVFGFASSYLMVFYTNILGISPAIVGILFLVARFIDAFTDIGMGVIVDRAKQAKDGKFKPWIRRMCGFVALTSFLMYQSALADSPMGLKIAYMFITYILWGSVAYTAINIPYGSMASAITDNPTERAILSTFRSTGSLGGMIVIGVIAPQVIYHEVDGQQVASGPAFTGFAAALSILSLISYLLCYKMTTERVKIEKNPDEKAPTAKESIHALFTSKSLLALIAATIVSLLASMMTQSMNSYLFINWFNDKNALSIVSVMNLPIILVMTVLVGKITDKFGKKEIGILGMLVSGIAYIILGFLKIQNPWIYILILFLSSIGLTYFNVVIWAFATDVIDDIEVKSRQREDGTVYGVFSFSRKMGQALAGGISGFALSAVGFVQGAASQTAAVNEGIYNISNFFPGIAYIVVALILLFAYPLSKEVIKQNSLELEKRRNNR